MILSSCKVESCALSHVQTTDRKFLFRHYMTHLTSQLEDAALDFGISIHNENKYSIINSLIHFSKVGVIQN